MVSLASDFDYTKEEIRDALTRSGVSDGDSIFVYSNIGFFGKLKDAFCKEDYYAAFKCAIFEAIGQDGTLVVPAFTYSFCSGKIFDRENTPSVCGLFSEMLRKDKDSLRSCDANFSISAIGKNAKFFTENAVDYSFGEDSFWGRFLEKEGKFCNFNFDSASTFIHFVERQLRVPYRFDKAFSGVVVSAGKEIKRTFYHFVYDLEKPEHYPEFSRFDRKAKEEHLAKVSNLGKGQIVSISAKDTFVIIEEGLKEDPFFLLKGKAA